MIASFKAKSLRNYWQKSDESGLKPEWVAKVRIILDALDAAARPEELDLPGLNWHPLKGNRKGQFSVSVSRNWRITYAFENGDAVHVNLEDYHD